MKDTIAGQVAGVKSWVLAHGYEVVLLLEIVVGIVLRFSLIGSVPPGLNVDEAVNGYDAYSLFLTGRDHHGQVFPFFTGLESYGDWVSPLLTFITVPAVGIFGLHVEVLRSVSAAIGVLAIPIVFWLSTAVTGRRFAGILAAGVIAVSPQHVHLSRWAIPPAVVPTMVALTLLLIVWSVRRRSDRGIISAAFVASLSVAAYPAMKLYIPLLGIAAIVILSTKVFWVKPSTLIIAMVIIGVIAGPVLYYTAFGGGGTRFQQVSVFQESGFSIAVLVEHYLSYFSPAFLFISSDGDPSHTPPGYGFELRSAAPFVLLGLIWLIYRFVRPSAGVDRSLFLFILVAVLLYPVPGSLTIGSPHTLRAAHLLPLSALIAGIGLMALIDALRWLVRRQRPDIAWGVPILVLGLVAVPAGVELRSRYVDYFRDYPAKVAPYFEYGMENVIRYLEAHDSEYDEALFADINQPYIYALFYEKVPPAEVQQSLQVRRNPPDFNHVDALRKYRFGSLTVRPPTNLPGESLGVLETISYPNGRTAFEITGWVTKEGKRTLLIWKP